MARLYFDSRLYSAEDKTTRPSSATSGSEAAANAAEKAAANDAAKAAPVKPKKKIQP